MVIWMEARRRGQGGEGEAEGSEGKRGRGGEGARGNAAGRNGKREESGRRDEER